MTTVLVALNAFQAFVFQTLDTFGAIFLHRFQTKMFSALDTGVFNALQTFSRQQFDYGQFLNKVVARKQLFAIHNHLYLLYWFLVSCFKMSNHAHSCKLVSGVETFNVYYVEQLINYLQIFHVQSANSKYFNSKHLYLIPCYVIVYYKMCISLRQRLN